MWWNILWTVVYIALAALLFWCGWELFKAEAHLLLQMEENDKWVELEVEQMLEEIDCWDETGGIPMILTTGDMWDEIG